MSTRIKDNVNYLGLSFGKEITKLIFINILLIGIIALMFFFKVTNMIVITIASFIPLLDYLYLSRYSDQVKRLKEERNNEFISLLSYFEIFISNRNNVYKSFEKLLPYSSEWMKERISLLLEEIDSDKSVAPFINFSNNFSLLVIQNVMISIYQMVEQGESKIALYQFDNLFNSLNDEMHENRIERQSKSLDSLNTFPLVGAGILIVILTLSIMSILGDIVNVI